MGNPTHVTTNQGTSSAKPYAVKIVGGGSGGSSTDVKINGVSITNNDIANIQTKGTYNSVNNKIVTESELPTKTSDLTNDDNTVKDASYVHTDNNYTTVEKTKLAGLSNYDDTAVKEQINNKVDKETGKGLSTNDYTTAEKTKLAGLNNYDDTNIKDEINVIGNAGAKNLLDVSIAKNATNVVDSIATDGAITFKATSSITINQCFAKATLKANVTYVITGDIVPTYGRVAVGTNSINMPNAAGGYKPDITMISGGASNVYLLQSRTNIKQSVFKSNADQDVYFWFAGDEGTSTQFTIRIMLRDASITDDTYVPYGMSNSELTSNVSALNKDKNLLGRMSGASLTTTGVTFTMDSNMAVNINGTATTHSYYTLSENLNLKAGTYRLTTGNSASAIQKFAIQFFNKATKSTSGAAVLVQAASEGATFTLTEDTVCSAYIVVWGGQTVTNQKMCPMLQDARISDTTYTEPIDTGWSNVTLTNSVSGAVCQCRKIGNKAYLQLNPIAFTDITFTANAFTSLANNLVFPEMVRPKANYTFSSAIRVQTGTTGEMIPIIIQVATNGSLNIYTPKEIAANANYRLFDMISYPV